MKLNRMEITKNDGNIEREDGLWETKNKLLKKREKREIQKQIILKA